MFCGNPVGKHCSEVGKYVVPPDHLRTEIFLAHLQHSKSMKKHENKELLKLNVYFVRIWYGFILTLIIQ